MDRVWDIPCQSGGRRVPLSWGLGEHESLTYGNFFGRYLQWREPPVIFIQGDCNCNQYTKMSTGGNYVPPDMKETANKDVQCVLDALQRVKLRQQLPATNPERDRLTRQHEILLDMLEEQRWVAQWQEAGVEPGSHMGRVRPEDDDD